VLLQAHQVLGGYYTINCNLPIIKNIKDIDFLNHIDYSISRTNLSCELIHHFTKLIAYDLQNKMSISNDIKEF